MCLVGLIGANVDGSLSPPLHEREADELGLRYLYKTIDIDRLGLPPEAVGELMAQARRLGFRGLNITHPCKQLALPHLDEASPVVAALGAVNTVVFEDGRAIGHNTDCAGFAQSFRRGLPDAPLDRVVLLGAGGAGSAVGHAALDLGARRLVVVDAARGRAEALAQALARSFGPGRVSVGVPDDVAGADGLIQATPVGMVGHPGMPLDPRLLHPGLWVAEVIYRPLETELLRRAREMGCRTLDGGGMVVNQAAESFCLFTGRTPDRERMLRHLAALTGDPVAVQTR
ncbi:MAG: shikimate dehydrogenase [Solirubrobacteraceae bacterium]